MPKGSCGDLLRRRLTTETYLGEVLANSLGGGADVVTEGTRCAGLAGALSKELAGNVGGIFGCVSQSHPQSGPERLALEQPTMIGTRKGRTRRAPRSLKSGAGNRIHDAVGVCVARNAEASHMGCRHIGGFRWALGFAKGRSCWAAENRRQRRLAINWGEGWAAAHWQRATTRAGSSALPNLQGPYQDFDSL